MQTIYTYKKIYAAYLECRRNKRTTANALKFEIDMEENLKKLLTELQNKTYVQSRSICFVVTKPTPREIFAAEFRDRIVHHLFVRELIEKAERFFIFDSFACLKGKGTHKAVRRLRKFSKDVSKNHTKDAWFLKLDLKSFFMAIDCDILFVLAKKMIEKHKKSQTWKNEMTLLASKIIFHRPCENYVRRGDPSLADLIPPHKSLLGQREKRGLPIGNYSSQFFANLYLNKLDHFIKRELKCQNYVRYVDDLVLLSSSKEDLISWKDEIEKFLKLELRMDLNCKKTVLQKIDTGVEFLGYFLKNEKCFVKRTVSGRYKNKLFWAVMSDGMVSWKKLQAIAASFRGHCFGV